MGFNDDYVLCNFYNGSDIKMKIQVVLINDSKSPEEIMRSFRTCKMDIESANRIYKYIDEILKKEDDKYIKYYKGRRGQYE